MKTVSLILITLIIPLMSIFGQGRDRQPAVAGSFYPSVSDGLWNELAGYFEGAGEPKPGTQVMALLVPHAGYVYSGRTAAQGFAAVPAEAIYDNVFLIGVSHRYAFEGAAVFTSGNMITPFGTIQVNREIGEKLKSTNKWFIEKDEAHGPEHSLEVQLPFIQYHFKSIPRIVPILIGTRNPNVLKAVASGLQPWFNNRNLFIISSDFSHYPTYEDACRVDRLASNAIVKGDPDDFLKTIRNIEASGTGNLATAMCGWPAGLVMLYLAGNSEGVVFRNVGYSNSGDSPRGDRDEVVGYNAIVAEKQTFTENRFNAENRSAEVSKAAAEDRFNAENRSAAVSKAAAEDRSNAENRSAEVSKAAAEDRSTAENRSAAVSKAAAGERVSGAGEFTLTAEERKMLLGIAREAVSAKLKGTRPAAVPEAAMTERLRQPLGAFVTITIDGDLRGCIGSFTSSDPLFKVVSVMALEAAFGDPRFPALTSAEYPSIHLEISVLGPMIKVNDISEIKIGKHGIYLKKGFKSGTLLPQVAQERGWNAEQFLGYCARDKAGIGWDGWKDKDTEIFVYEAYVFGE